MRDNLKKQAEELQAILGRLGMSYEEVGKVVAIRPETMRKIVKGYQKASDALMQSIRNIEAVQKSAVGSPKESRAEHKLTTLTARRKVPVVSWTRAGLIHERGLDYEDLASQLEEQVETDSKDPNSFGLIIEGDSMEPMYLPGDRVVFAPNEEPRNGDFVVARLRDTGETLFKRFYRTGREGMTVKLESINKNYKTAQFKVSDFRFIYPAVDMIRKIRR